MSGMPPALVDGRYRPREQIAVGGMGEVWLGEDTLLQRPIAIKTLRVDFAGDPEFRERFRAEARHAAGLTHPNVRQVFDLVDDEQDAPPSMVMEYVAGESLAAILQREAPLDAERTWSILGQTAAALAAAHQVGIVHRDIKPGNILVCPDGRVKVSDFGIARAFGEASATHPGLVLGTASYLAPEQLAGEQATPASDMYALGVVGYQCLTGRPPFPGDIPEVLRAHQTGEPPALPPAVPLGLADLVLALLAKDPAARPNDPGAIAGQAQRMAKLHARPDQPAQEAAPAPYPDEPTQAAAPPWAQQPLARAIAGPRRTLRDLRRVGQSYPSAVAAGVLVVIIVAATLLATSILTTGPSRHEAGGSSATPGASLAAKSVAASGASLVGSSDHPEELQYVTDSSPTTAWYTEHYSSAAFGDLKSGIGLVVRTSSSAAVRAVMIRFAQPGVAASLYAGGASSLPPQGKALATTSSAPGEWRVALPTSVRAQSWLIWITRLVPDSGGYRAGVADVRFLT